MKAAASLDWALYFAMKQMPAAWSSSFAAAVSVLPRRTFPAAQRDAKALFAALRPDWARDPDELEAAAGRLWANVARVYGEVPGGQRLVRQGRVTLENGARIDGAMASGRPVIVMFVHTGNWELSGIQLALRYPSRMIAIYDPPKRASHAAIVHHERRKLPVDLLPMSRMVWRQALTRLRQPGGVLWIPGDEFAFSRVNAPFFGRPPRLDGNLGKIARLALRTGAIVVPFFSERHDGLRFTTHILPPLTFDGAADDDQAVLAAVQAIDTILAPPVISLLDQWYMALFYRDFAARPADMPAAT